MNKNVKIISGSGRTLLAGVPEGAEARLLSRLARQRAGTVLHLALERGDRIPNATDDEADTRDARTRTHRGVGGMDLGEIHGSDVADVVSLVLPGLELP